jgi:1,2-diacylglycerol 3-alpha-glucosyltransferase
LSAGDQQQNRLRALMLSFDPHLAAPDDNDAIRRHREYAALADSLTILVHTRRGQPAHERREGNLHILPTRSFSPLTFVPDALHLFGRLRMRPDVIVAQDMYLTGLAGWLLKRRLRAPLLVQDHSLVFDNPALLDEHPLRNRALVALADVVVRGADRVRSVSEESRASIVRRGIDPARIDVLPLATASPDFAARIPDGVLAEKRAALGIAAEARIVLWAGRPVPFKRLPLLLDAFARAAQAVPDAHLLLLGDFSSARPALEADIARLGIHGRVTLHGPVPHEQLPAYYQMAAVYALSSTYEGMPRVLVEAAASRLPLVATGLGGISAILKHEENGFFVPESDDTARDIAARLVMLLHDADLARRMGEAGHRRAFSQFSTEGYAERFVALWHKTADGTRAR